MSCGNLNPRDHSMTQSRWWLVYRYQGENGDCESYIQKGIKQKRQNMIKDFQKLCMTLRKEFFRALRVINFIGENAENSSTEFCRVLQQ
jgi:hypothetical protein